MNLLKSLFISLYVTCLLLGVSHSLFGLYQGADHLFWLGVLITLLPCLAFFIRLFLAPIARTSASLKSIFVPLALGAGLSALTLTERTLGFFGLYSLTFGLIGWSLYVFWYSKLGRQPSAQLEVGHRPTPFSLTALDGSRWASDDHNHYPALMLFFRGNWCPLCMAQIKEIAQAYQKLESLGVKTFLVSPQPESHTRSLADKCQVNFTFLADPGNQAAKQLGIDAKHGTPKGLELLGYDSDTVLPTAIAFDASGKVIWSDQTDNYRVRPEPETFLAVFKDHGAGLTH